MAKTVYSIESEVWKLYEMVEGRTRQILDTESYQFPGSDYRPDDVVIESGDVRLVGAYGFSGLVYKWYPDEDWILVTFRSEPPVPFDRYGDLLQILENRLSLRYLLTGMGTYCRFLRIIMVCRPGLKTKRFVMRL